MKRLAVLWLGSEEHCRALIEIYSERIISRYLTNKSAVELARISGKYDYVVFAAGGNLRDFEDDLREVCAFSEENDFPVYLIGNQRVLHVACELSPNADIRPVYESELFRGDVGARPKVPTIVVIANSSEYFAFCEERAERQNIRPLRAIYCGADFASIERLKRRRARPGILLACGEGAAAIAADEFFSDIPYIYLHHSDGKLEPFEREPYAAVDIRTGGNDIIRLVREAEQENKKKRLQQAELDDSAVHSAS